MLAPISFLILAICVFSFSALINPIRILSILFTLSVNQLLVSIIFFIILPFSGPLLAVLTYIIFLLLDLALTCPFPPFFR